MNSSLEQLSNNNILEYKTGSELGYSKSMRVGLMSFHIG
jgi:hypothetical protein